MTDRVFVDTNVWVYAVDRADPVKQARAREVLDPAHGAAIVTSAQVLGEFYTTVTRKLASPIAPGVAAVMVERIRRLPVIEIDAERVGAAIEGSRSWQLSYWDALIVASARAGGCSRLLTEDLADGSVVAGVRIENPFAAGDRRLAEPVAPYGSAQDRTWSEQGLRDELERYRETCSAAGMRRGAVHAYWDYARRFLDWREGTYPRGAASRPVPQRPLGIAELRADVAAYAQRLDGAVLSRAARDTYVRHARFFTRWLAGEFEPGARLHRRR